MLSALILVVATALSIPVSGSAAARNGRHTARSVYRPVGHHRVVLRRGRPVALRFGVRGGFSSAVLVVRARGHGLVAVSARGARRRVAGRLRRGRLSLDVTMILRHARRLVLHGAGRVELRSVWLVVRSARGVARESHVLAAVGDICSTSCSQGAKTAAAIRSFSPERLLGLGDYQYEDDGSNGSVFKTGYQLTFAALNPITIPAFGATHDTCAGSGAWECYAVSFFNASGAPEVRGKLSDDQWGYSLDYAGWHIVVFNYRYRGGTGPVEADLSSHPARCLMAIDHAPVIGSATSEHPTNEAGAWRQVLVNHGVDLILNGHQHFYERNKDPAGFTEITDGEGGIGHYPKTSTAGTEQAYNDTSFGPVKVTLTSDGWSSDFVPDAGAARFADHASGGC